MAKNIDLTGKLGLEGMPTITVGDTVLTVDNSARTLLRVLNEVGDEPTAKDMLAAADMIFDKESRKALDQLHLSFEDFARVMEAALDLAMGGAEGEAETPGTTS